MLMEYVTEEMSEVTTALKNIDEMKSLLLDIKRELPSTVGREHYLTGAEVRRFLHISTRTLQNLRDNRMIPYTIIGSKNIVYPESQIRQLLHKNYRPAIDG